MDKISTNMERQIKSMTVGFTGTRSGMSDKQKLEVIEYLTDIVEFNKIDNVLHGGCIGADQDFHDMCVGVIREVYPGYSAKDKDSLVYRGTFKGADIVHEPQTHFKRNRDIVDRCDILIATPYNDVRRGGTWYTIDYAKKIGKPVIILTRE